MEDMLITLLHQAQDTRNSIWTFYIIIITTAFGVAFSDGYQKLDTWIKVMLSIAVGASVWYNFFALVGNSKHIHEIIIIIENEMSVDNPAYKLFSCEHCDRRHGGNVLMIQGVYIPVNLAIGVAMWWTEIEYHLGKRIPFLRHKKRDD